VARAEAHAAEEGERSGNDPAAEEFGEEECKVRSS
tara:strand:+ start:1029 stop:1133 length:105 start_codon:yes stop_codon:yes gene_type:complete